MLIEDVKRKQPKVFRQWQEQPEIVCPPEGEMLSEAHERVQAALTKMLKKHKEGTIALVIPEPLASLVQCVAVAAVRSATSGKAVLSAVNGRSFTAGAARALAETRQLKTDRKTAAGV